MHSIGNSICDWGGIIENLQAIILGADIDGTFRCVKTKTLHPSAHYVY